MNFDELEDLWTHSNEELEQKITINQPILNYQTGIRLKSNAGNIRKTATDLGVSENTVRKKIELYEKY